MQHSNILKPIILLLFVCLSCKERKDNYANFTTDYEPVVSLKENIELVGNVQSFNFLNKDTLVVAASNPLGIYLYSTTSGMQLSRVGNYGGGPYEYKNPAIVKVHNNKIYVWDSQMLKLIVYNNKGLAVNEYTRFDQAIEDFVIYKNKICFYFSGGHSSLVGVFNLEDKQLLYGAIKTSEAHKLLSTNACAKPMFLDNNNILFTSSNALEVKLLNLDNYEIATKGSIIDEEFKANSIKNAADIVNSNSNKLIDYLMNSSYVKRIFKTDDSIIVNADTGYFYLNDDKSLNTSKRITKFYILDHDLNLIGVSQSDYDLDNQNCLISLYNNTLYGIKINESSKTEFNFELSKIKFETNNEKLN